jgi:hypothetical protein
LTYTNDCSHLIENWEWKIKNFGTLRVDYIKNKNASYFYSWYHK